MTVSVEFLNFSTAVQFKVVDEGFFHQVKILQPVALELELRSLTSLQSLKVFMHALVQRLKTRRDFEAIEAVMSVFLRLHADILITNKELKESLEELEEVQRTQSQRLSDLISSSLGTLNFVRDIL